MKLKGLIITTIALLSLGYVNAQANLLNAVIPEQIGMKTPEQLAADNDKPLDYGYVDDRDILWSKVVWEYVDLNELGAVTVKGIRMEPTPGNNTPRMVEVYGGLVNAIGLQGPGVDGFIENYLPFLRTFDVPVIINIWGKM